MIISGIFETNFFTDLFEKRKVPAICNINGQQTDTEPVNKSEIKQYEINLDRSITSLQLVPEYLNITISPDFHLKSVFQKKSYAANLKSCHSAEDYLKTYFKGNFRNNVRKSVRRVNICLNVDYKVFYGNISSTEYTNLMADFHNILKKRFEYLNTRNLVLENWQHYLDSTYTLIQKKEACLFVIYNKKEPIAFALNYPFNDVLYFGVPTFDLSYSKFSLGNVVLYKILEWCFDNNFNFFDLGYGDFRNKINWSNTNYNYNHLLICKNNSFKAKWYYGYLKYKYLAIDYLISKNFHTFIRTLKNKVKGVKATALPIFTFSEITNNLATESSHLQEIEINGNTPPHIKMAVYDFVYTKIENINDITIYRSSTDLNTYIVKGKNNQLCLTFLTK
ncbi:MAG: GNAT family N-acetyltransferase [Aestuariibaculum sp.]